MLEVVFNDNEKGSMKLAKDYNGKRTNKAELEKHYEDKAVGESSKDVVNIGFSLDVGDIFGSIDGYERQSVFLKLWGRFGFDKKEQEQFFLNQRRDMESLLSAAKDGVPIRIWKSDAPYSTCGFYFVCNRLRNIDCDISVISLPKYKQRTENEMVRYSHWGEVGSSELYKFLYLEKQLSQIEKKIYSDHWDRLVLENAPLRTIINGELISVPENFYDLIITANCPENDFIMVQFIGELLGKYNLGISDSWYAFRIDKMIADGKLVIVEDKDKSHPYGKILRRT